jgi:hypothetical protein
MLLFNVVFFPVLFGRIPHKYLTVQCQLVVEDRFRSVGFKKYVQEPKKICVASWGGV